MHNNPIFPHTPDSFRRKVQQVVQENMKTTIDTVTDKNPNLKNYTEEATMKNLMDIENNPIPTNKHMNRKHTWQKKAIVAAIAIAIAGAGGFTVHAVVENMAKQRLESMSEKEIESLLDEADTRNAEADTYSRELTDEEEERKIDLSIAYKEGRFPEGKLKKVEDESQIDKDTVCYVPSTGYLYLPERELTDEELLQIIDNQKKTNYALIQRSAQTDEDGDGKTLTDEWQAAEERRQELKQQAEADGEISEEEAIAIAQEYFNKLFGEMDDRLDITCYITDAVESPELQAGAGEKPFYVVRYFMDEVPFYIFHISSAGGAPFYVMLNDGYSWEEVSLSEAESNIQVMYQKAEEYLQDCFGISEEYKEVYCSYNINDAGSGIHMNDMIFWFVKEGGTGYKLTFDCKNIRFAGFGIENYEEYLREREKLELSGNIGKTISTKLK